MKCKHFNELLAGYLDNELAAGDKKAVEDHLSTCPVCREEVGRLSQIQRDLSEALKMRAEEVVPSPHVWENVRDNISLQSAGLLFGIGFEELIVIRFGVRLCL